VSFPFDRSFFADRRGDGEGPDGASPFSSGRANLARDNGEAGGKNRGKKLDDTRRRNALPLDGELERSRFLIASW